MVAGTTRFHPAVIGIHRAILAPGRANAVRPEEYLGCRHHPEIEFLKQPAKFLIPRTAYPRRLKDFRAGQREARSICPDGFRFKQRTAGRVVVVGCA